MLFVSESYYSDWLCEWSADGRLKGFRECVGVDTINLLAHKRANWSTTVCTVHCTYHSLKLYKPTTRGLQRDVVYLGWPMAPSYMYEPKCGGSGELRGLSQWVQLYTGPNSKFNLCLPHPKKLKNGKYKYLPPTFISPLLWVSSSILYKLYLNKSSHAASSAFEVHV